jgi:hypothetical protein
VADDRIDIEVNVKDDASAKAAVIAHEIDNIGDKAAKAAAKLAALDAALKATGNETVTANVKVKESRSEMDRFGDAAMRADNKIKKSIGGKNSGLFGMINFGFRFKALFSFFKWGVIADGITAIGSSIAALGGAAVAGVSAMTPLLGVVGAAPGLIGALGQSMAVLKMGFKGLSEVTKPLFDKLNADINKVIGPSLQKLATGMLSANGAIRNGLLATARQIKPAIKDLDQYLNKGAGKGQLGSFMQNNAQIAGKLSTLAVPGMKALFAVIQAATPMTNMLVDKFTAFGTSLADLTTKNGPAMTNFFNNAGRIFMNTTHVLGDFAKGLYTIGKLSVGLGGSMGNGIMKIASDFRAWTESAAGQNRIKQFFEDIRPPLQAAWKLLVAVGQAFGRISVSGKGMEALTKTFDSLRGTLVPTLEKILTAAQGEMIPKLAEALGNIVDIMNNLKMAEILGGFTKALSVITSVVSVLPDPIKSLLGVLVTAAALVKIIGFGIGGWASGIGAAIASMVKYIGQLIVAKALSAGQGLSGGNAAAKGVGKFLPAAAGGAATAAEGAAGTGAFSTAMSVVMSGLTALGGGSAAAGTALLAIPAAVAGLGYFDSKYRENSKVIHNADTTPNAKRVMDVSQKAGNGFGGYPAKTQMGVEKLVQSEQQNTAIAKKAKEYYDLGDSIEEATRKAKEFGESQKQVVHAGVGASLGQQVGFVTRFGNALSNTDKRWTAMLRTSKGQKQVGQQFQGLASYAKMSGSSVQQLATKFPGLTAALARNGKTIDQTTGKIVKLDGKAKAKRNPIKYQTQLLDKATRQMNTVDKKMKTLTKQRNQLIIKGKDAASPEVSKIDKKIQGLSKKKATIGAKIDSALTQIEKLTAAVVKPEVKPVNIGGDWASQIAEINRLASEPVTKPVKIDEQRFAGGPVWAGLTSWVGELGPEMLVRPGMAPEMVGTNGPAKMDFHSSGTIIPNHMLPEMATAGNVRQASVAPIPSTPHTGSGGASTGIHIDKIVATENVDISRALVMAQRQMERDQRERAIRPASGRRR